MPFPTFSFHGIFHLPQVYRQMPDFLVDHLSDRIVRTRLGYLLPGLAVVAPASAERLRARAERLQG